MSWYREQLENYLKQLEVNADTVFDIGGGAWPVKERVKSWNVGKYVIYDNNQEKAKEDILIVDFDINIDNFPSDKVLTHNKADIIFCLEVFEYVYDPITAVRNIWNMLKERGKAYITFPFVYPMHEPITRDYLRYTEEGVYKLLEKAGFSRNMINIKKRVDKSGLLQSFYRADGMHPAKISTKHDATGWIVEITK